MNAATINLHDLFYLEELREAAPSASGLAEFLRASATSLFDTVGESPGGAPLALSGRAVRLDVTERLSPLFSFGSTAGDALFEAGDDEVDVTAPQLRVVFDALLEVGDFIEMGRGRFYPSRTRAVGLGEGTWIIVAGAPARHLGLADAPWSRRSFSRVTAQLPNQPIVIQSLHTWLGLEAPDYVRFAEAQLGLPLQPLRQGVAGWKIASLESARTDWIDPSDVDDFTQPLIARFRSDEQQSWQRFVARLRRSPDGVECVAARPLGYRDCSRILHGQKMLRGFTPRLRSVQSDTDFRVYCDSYFLAEVQRLLVALSYDFSQTDNVTEYRFALPMRQPLERALTGLGVKIS